jgi:hypothetical protein
MRHTGVVDVYWNIDGATSNFAYIKGKAVTVTTSRGLTIFLKIGSQMAVRLSTLHAGRLLSPGRFLVLISAKNWPPDRRSQYNLTWTCVIALQITDPSSRQRGRPTWRRKKVTQRNVTSGQLLQKGHSTKTNWPPDRRSQYNILRWGWGFQPYTPAAFLLQ